MLRNAMASFAVGRALPSEAPQSVRPPWTGRPGYVEPRIYAYFKSGKPTMHVCGGGKILTLRSFCILQGRARAANRTPLSVCVCVRACKCGCVRACVLCYFAPESLDQRRKAERLDATGAIAGTTVTKTKARYNEAIPRS